MSGLVWCFGIVVMACQAPPPPPRTTTIVCPPLVAWPASDQAAAADALAALPAGHPLRKLGVVAVRQRDVVRACAKARD